MKLRNSKLAFSLIELSVVILIIGILVIGITKGSRIIRASKLRSAESITTNSPVASIDNIVIWVEATSEKSFNSGEAIDTAIGQTGTISAWRDINPYTTTPNNASQSTSGDRPRYLASAINGLPAVNFDGSTDFLGYDGTSIANSNYSIFVVEQRRNGLDDRYFLAGAVGGVTNQNLHFGYRFNNTLTIDQWGNNTDIAVPTFSNLTPRLHALRFGKSIGRNYYLNGQGPLINCVTVACQTPLISYISAQIGGRNSEKYFGDIGEVIIFKKYLTNEERISVEKYLKSKWGIK